MIFPVSHRNWRKCGWIIGGGGEGGRGGGGRGKGYVGPPLKLWGEGGRPPLPTPMFLGRLSRSATVTLIKEIEDI